MAMTELEKKLMKMSPAERKKAVDFVSEQMGMPSKKNAPKKGTSKRGK